MATLGLLTTPPGHGLEGGDVGVATKEKNNEKEKIKENIVIVALCVYIL